MKQILQRPHQYYRDEFLRLIRSCSPNSVLDVGCGEGALLETLQKENIQAAGADPHPAFARSESGGGYSITTANAERLPFDSCSFDIVVSEFSLHHFHEPLTALREAMRVARRFVLILDVWYDKGVPSQRTAAMFDEWVKEVDRQEGMIHWPAYSTDEIRTMLALVEGVKQVEVMTLLKLMMLPLDHIRNIANRRLHESCAENIDASKLDVIYHLIERYGVSDDGAVIAIAQKA